MSNRNDHKIFVRVVGPNNKGVNDMSLAAAKRLYHNGWRIEDPRFDEQGRPVKIEEAVKEVEAVIKAEFEEPQAEAEADAGPEPEPEPEPETKTFEVATQDVEAALKKVAFARSAKRLNEYKQEFEHMPAVIEKIEERLKKYE